MTGPRSRHRGLFEAVAVRQFDWEVVYDAQAYINLLETFSGHITMQAWQRERLYGEIRTRLAEREDGRLRRHWGAVPTQHDAARRPRPDKHLRLSPPTSPVTSGSRPACAAWRIDCRLEDGAASLLWNRPSQQCPRGIPGCAGRQSTRASTAALFGSATLGNRGRAAPKLRS